MNKFLRGLYFSPDGTPGGGTGDGTGAEDDAAEKTKAEEKAKAEAEAKAKEKAGKDDDQEAGEKKFSQADVDNIVKERLERAQKKAEQDAAKAAKKAEEENLAKNQEFEKLAKQRQTRVTELEAELETLKPFQEQAEKYKKALEADLKARTEKLPGHIKTLLEKMDPVEQIEYLTANAKELGVKFGGVPPTPQDESDKDLTKEQQDKARRDMANLARGWV